MVLDSGMSRVMFETLFTVFTSAVWLLAIGTGWLLLVTFGITAGNVLLPTTLGWIMLTAEMPTAVTTAVSPTATAA